jgi:hypothetical protein
MKNTFITLLFCLFATATVGQTKLVDKFFSPDTNKRNSFLPLPALAYNQEAGFQFGAIGLYSFYIDKKDPVIRPSQFYAIAYTSTKGQSQVSLKTDLWSRANKWHHIYEARFYNLPFNFYGTGGKTLLANEDKIIQKRFRLNAEVERALTKSYYPGLGIEFESLSIKDKELGGIYDTENFTDKNGGKFLMFKLTQLLDTRNTNTYTTRGLYARMRFGYAPDFFKEENFSGTFTTLDGRYFTSPSKKTVLATQVFYESLGSNKAIPFYMLRQMGNDQMMRGYYLGRYRDKNYLAVQAELRYRFIDRLGLVAFAGTASVYGQEKFDTGNLKPNYGIGGRFLFDLDKSLSLRLDYGFGEKPPGEKRISGFYISLGEAF